jgi:hypothetical protein
MHHFQRLKHTTLGFKKSEMLTLSYYADINPNYSLNTYKTSALSLCGLGLGVYGLFTASLLGLLCEGRGTGPPDGTTGTLLKRSRYCRSLEHSQVSTARL